MSYDLKVMILGQSEPVDFTSNINIINEMQEQLRYNLSWRFVSSMNGIMYSLGKKDGFLFNAMPIIDTDFDNPAHYPYWVKDEEVLSNLTPIKLKYEYEAELKKLIKDMIRFSPINMIMFMTRYQSGDAEVVCGIIKLSEFLNLLSDNKVLFNVCYIVEGD